MRHPSLAIKFKWPEAVYELKDGRDVVLVFTKWLHPTKTSPPTRVEIEGVFSEMDIAQTDEKTSRRNRKRQVLADLNIPANKKEAFIQGLKELIEDGDENR